MLRYRPPIVLVLTLAMLLAPTVAAADESDGSSILLILDASGSMWGQIEGENKIVIARRVLGDLVDGLAAHTEVGVIAYGHRREGDCEDIETVVAMGPLDKDGVKRTVDELNPKGKTPITASVQRAFADLSAADRSATVILISDGLETCGGDPCAAVRAAKKNGIDFIMHVVGFDVAKEDVSQLECTAQAGEGLFLSAENADELSAALEQAVALPPEIPAGRLSLKAIADGKLQDAAVHVTHANSGEEAGGGRTYTDEGTNPRMIPLPDGDFIVEVKAVGIKGDITRNFEIEILEGNTVERIIDYSTGEISIGVTRNGELSDAVYKVLVPETGAQAASGRTYVAGRSNPAIVRITSGTYDVEISSVEITNGPTASLGQVTVDPGGRVEVSHNWQTGLLKVGAVRGSDLVDATLKIIAVETGQSVGGGRTYTSEKSNPKPFVLPPGEYRIDVREIRGERREVTATVTVGTETVAMVDLAGGD